MRLNPRVRRKRASETKVTPHHTPLKTKFGLEDAAARSSPHTRVEEEPNPRKASEATAWMLPATPSVKMMMMVESVLGRICLVMIL